MESNPSLEQRQRNAACFRWLQGQGWSNYWCITLNTGYCFGEVSMNETGETRLIRLRKDTFESITPAQLHADLLKQNSKL